MLGGALNYVGDVSESIPKGPCGPLVVMRSPGVRVDYGLAMG